jgi:hypothetical protein
MPTLTRSVVRVAAIAAALGLASLASACVHVSQRVWYNGQALTSSNSYSDFMAGDHSPRTLRGLYYSSDARFIGQPSPRYGTLGPWRW